MGHSRVTSLGHEPREILKRHCVLSYSFDNTLNSFCGASDSSGDDFHGDADIMYGIEKQAENLIYVLFQNFIYDTTHREPWAQNTPRPTFHPT